MISSLGIWIILAAIGWWLAKDADLTQGARGGVSK